VVSNTLAYRDVGADLESPDRAYQIVAEMGLNPAEGRCEQILVQEEFRAGIVPGNPSVELIDHHVWVDRTSFRFTVSHDSYARLAYSYYPYLDVQLDGEPIDYFSTAEGFIGLTVPAGEHTIRISGRSSPLRKGLLVMVIVVFGCCAALIVRQKWFRSASVDTALQ
jgi:hypothetical protein